MALTEEITLTDIDFEFIEACSKPQVLKKCIVLLEQDGGYYHQLLDAARQKLASLLKDKTGVGRSGIALRPPSECEVKAAKADLLAWQRSLSPRCKNGADARNTEPREANQPGLPEVRNEGTAIKNKGSDSQGDSAVREAEADSDDAMKNSGGPPIVRSSPSSSPDSPGLLHCRGVGVGASKGADTTRRPTERKTGRRDSFKAATCVGPNERDRRRRGPVRIRVLVEQDESESGEEGPTGNRTNLGQISREDSGTPRTSRNSKDIGDCPPVSAGSSLSTCVSVTTACTSPSPVTSADTNEKGPRQSSSENDKRVEQRENHCSVRQVTRIIENEKSPGTAGSPHTQPTCGGCSLRTFEDQNTYSPRTREILAIKEKALTAFSRGEFEKSLGLLTACLEGAEERSNEGVLPDKESQLNLSPNVPLYKRHFKCQSISPELHSVLYSNRSLVYMKLGKHARAAEDSLRAMQLDSKNVKALWRRAQALYALGGEENLRQAATVAKRMEALLSSIPGLSNNLSGLSPAKQLSEFQLAVNSAMKSS